MAPHTKMHNPCFTLVCPCQSNTMLPRYFSRYESICSNLPASAERRYSALLISRIVLFGTMGNYGKNDSVDNVQLKFMSSISYIGCVWSMDGWNTYGCIIFFNLDICFLLQLWRVLKCFFIKLPCFVKVCVRFCVCTALCVVTPTASLCWENLYSWSDSIEFSLDWMERFIL